MSWVIKLSVLLVLLIQTIHTDLHLRTKEESYDLYIPNDVDYCLISRSSDEENLLLWNISNPLENSIRAGMFKDRLELIQDQNSLYLRINRLTQSDSGQYKMECWRDGMVSYQSSTDLIVCGGRGEMKNLYTHPGDTVELQCGGKKYGDNTTVRWFYGDRQNSKYLESKTSSSFIFNNISKEDIRYLVYVCVVLEGQDCISRHTYTLYPQVQYVGMSVGDEAVLPCFNYDDPNGTETKWNSKWFKTHYESISWNSNHLIRGGNQMYVSDGRTSGNYSLVFTSLMLNYSGWYGCYDNLQPMGDKLIKGFELLVCPKSELLTKFFSEGEEVVLSCNSDLTESDRVVWYRQTAQVNDAILDTGPYNLANYPEDLGGRINASEPQSFLVLSNLSLADSGEYWCAVFYEELCVSVTKTVLVEWDPFGIDSMFYRVYFSLMACALLGKVCVLITVNLKTKRRYQASLMTRRTADQIKRQRSCRVKDERKE